MIIIKIIIILIIITKMIWKNDSDNIWEYH